MSLNECPELWRSSSMLPMTTRVSSFGTFYVTAHVLQRGILSVEAERTHCLTGDFITLMEGDYFHFYRLGEEAFETLLEAQCNAHERMQVELMRTRESITSSALES